MLIPDTFFLLVVWISVKKGRTVKIGTRNNRWQTEHEIGVLLPTTVCASFYNSKMSMLLRNRQRYIFNIYAALTDIFVIGDTLK